MISETLFVILKIALRHGLAQGTQFENHCTHSFSLLRNPPGSALTSLDTQNGSECGWSALQGQEEEPPCGWAAGGKKGQSHRVSGVAWGALRILSFTPQSVQFAEDVGIPGPFLQT